MAALLVEADRSQWETTLGEAFPEPAAIMDPVYRDVPLADVLRHRGGRITTSSRCTSWYRASREAGAGSGNDSWNDFCNSLHR